jgi:hypothetical protein
MSEKKFWPLKWYTGRIFLATGGGGEVAEKKSFNFFQPYKLCGEKAFIETKPQ